MRYYTCLVLMFVNMSLCAQDAIVSTSKDTKKTSLSVYNDGFAIVREQRNLRLNSGMNMVRYEDVAARIDATSLSIKSLSFPDALSVREQNYQYDLLTPESILSKSVGKMLRFRRQLSNGQFEVLEGVLLNPPSSVISVVNGGDARSEATYNGLVIRTNDNKIILNPRGELLIDEVPKGLVPRPSLLWKINSTKSGDHTTEVSYMSEGIQWNADYVTILNDADTKLDLTGWVTLTNNSGATYNDAQLQLIAGTVRRAQEEETMYAGRNKSLVMRSMDAGAPAFQEQSFFEYHLYTLGGTTTISENETKQMQLLSANGVDMRKKLIFDSEKYNSHYTDNPGDGSATTGAKAAIIVELKNSKANNMGMPLPKGKVRVYKADSQNRLQFVGEDRVDHTPQDETVKLYIGDAFDVVGSRIQKDYKQISKRVSETTFEITIRNHKQSSTEAFVVEHFYGDWEIISSSVKSTNIDGRTVEFPLNLAKDESKTLSFTVRNKW